jgi:uncharacterized membrane protein (UPF0127 family)
MDSRSRPGPRRSYGGRSAMTPTTRPKRGLPFLFGMMAVGVLATTAVFLLPAIKKPAPSPTARASGTGPLAIDYQLRGSGQPVTVRLEVAADPPSRTKGLSGRRSVPPGTGMVFLYPVDTNGGFWMKDTLVPLSIAFVASNGQVVSTNEMVPCQADPCPVYQPAKPYRYAVELPAGALAAARVGPGSLVLPLRADLLPAAT